MMNRKSKAKSVEMKLKLLKTNTKKTKNIKTKPETKNLLK